MDSNKFWIWSTCLLLAAAGSSEGADVIQRLSDKNADGSRRALKQSLGAVSAIQRYEALRVQAFVAPRADRAPSGSAKKVRTDTAPVSDGGGGVAGFLNDDCATAQTLIAGEGAFPFNNSLATEDGPDHAACNSFNELSIESDVWFCWTAQTDCQAMLTTCDQTTVDTKIAVYDGCACPKVLDDPLDCNDDGCQGGGVQSSVTFAATASQSYLIRLGTFPGASGGTGTFSITCAPAVLCTQPDANCQGNDADVLNLSNDVNFRIADGFSPVTNGSVTDVCWWGAYFNGVNGDCVPIPQDSFRITYFDDAGGQPGSPLAVFSQTPQAGEQLLNLTGASETGALTNDLKEFQFTASHAAVNVAAGQCYWIQITNDSSGSADCFWFWEHAVQAGAPSGGNGDGRIFQDGDPPDGYGVEDVVLDDQAFCLNLELGAPGTCLPPPPSNDDCPNATVLTQDGVYMFETTGATTDGPPEPTCGFPNNPDMTAQDQITQDIWFDYTATCTGTVEVSLCGSPFDTTLALYDGHDCPPLSQPIVCNDDFCGGDTLLASQASASVTLGQAIKIRVGGYSTVTFPPGLDVGPGQLQITCGDAPPNDSCVDAPVQTLSIGASVPFTGSNQLATNDCAQLPGSHVWVAIDLLETASVTVDYTGTAPVFNAAWGNFLMGCPCATVGDPRDCESAGGDGNIVLTWDCLPPGLYYYPILSEPGSQGDYTVTISADACITDRCGPKTGSCFAEHAGPGCDDAVCCDIVCAQDDVCCCSGWDSFCVAAAQALCDGPFDAFCAGASGDCFSEQPVGVGGCGGFDCCTAVCECDPFCCNVRWDLACSTTGVDPNNCGAELLCSQCPDGTIEWDTPPDGWQDSRQPNPSGNLALLQGLGTLIVTGPPGADIVGCWDNVCETNQNVSRHPPGLSPNGVVSVADLGGGQYELTLSRPITPGEITKITYQSSTGMTQTSCSFTFLPGDANGDGNVTPHDGLAMINHLLNTVPLPLDQADVNRSGAASPADVARWTEVLKGIEVHAPWNGASVSGGCP